MSVNENESEEYGRSIAKVVTNTDPQKVSTLKEKIQLFRGQLGIRELVLERIGMALRKVQQTASEGNSSQKQGGPPPQMTIEQEECALRERLEDLEKQKLERARENISLST